MKISVVVPAYNEEDTITNTIDALERYLKGYQAASWWEIIIVNDGSTDNTLDKLKSYQKGREWLKVIDLGINQGRGAAIRRGISNARGEIIVTLDADLSYAPYHIERMVSKLVATHADIVVASAYGKGGTVKNVPFNRLIISRIGNKILSHMYGEGLSVLTCIVRAYRSEFIQSLDLHSNNKDIHLEILYKAKILGARIVEVPADLAWPSHKGVRHTTPKRRSTLKFRKTTSSHFFFALINKPGLVFVIPGLILFFLSLCIISICFYAMLPDLHNGMSLYMALRKSMIETATPSWMTAVFSFLLSVQFFSWGFLTNQSKRNYEETYRTNHAILKCLQEKK